MKKLSKTSNASKLVNEVMSDYFFVGDNQKKEELQKNIIQLHEKISGDKIEVHKLEESLKKLLKKEEELKLIFKDIPKEILDDFKEFPNMTEMALGSRYKDIYKKKFKIKYSRVLEAFRHK